MQSLLQQAWRFLRAFKPLRTFWQTLAGALVVGESAGALGLGSLQWEMGLSIAAAAAVLSFVTIMPTDQSFWADEEGEKK